MAGPIATTGVAAIKRAEQRRKARQATLRDRGFYTEGLRVMLSHARGVTRAGVLDTPFYFQMPPQENFQVGHSATFNDQETIGGESLSRPGAVGLRTVTFSTLTLDYDWTFATHHRGGIASESGVNDPHAPDYSGADAFSAQFGREDKTFGRSVRAAPPDNPLVVSYQLRVLLESRSPFLLLAGQPQVWGRYDLGMIATLRTLDVRETAGEPDTRYLDVSFTEFIRPELLRRQRKGTPQAHPQLPATVTARDDGTAVDSHGRHIKHVVESGAHGVSLYDLASHYYGSHVKWRIIAKANHLTGITPDTGIKDWLTKRKRKSIKLRIPKSSHGAS